MGCPTGFGGVLWKRRIILNKHLLGEKEKGDGVGVVCRERRRRRRRKMKEYERWREKIEKERGGRSRPGEYEQVQQGK